MEFEALGVDEALRRLMRLTRHDCIQSIAKLRRQQGTLLLNTIAKQFGLRVEVFDDEEQDLAEFGAVFKSRNSKSRKTEKTAANDDDDDNDADDQSKVEDTLNDDDDVDTTTTTTNDNDEKSTTNTTNTEEFKKPAKVLKKRGLFEIF
jgi:hypothetical protein